MPATSLHPRSAGPPARQEQQKERPAEQTGEHPKPTTPIGPLSATAAAVINDALIMVIQRRRWIRTPSETASPSLSTAAFNCPLRYSSTVQPMAMTTPPMAICVPLSPVLIPP